MEEILSRLELIKYVQTHWSLIYDLFECTFKLKAVSRFNHTVALPLLMSDQAITKFINLANDSPQVPDLQKKSYANFRLTSNEWANLALLHDILKVLTTACNLI